MLPTQKQFKTIARDVKKLADTILQGEAPEDEVSDEITAPDPTEISENITDVNGTLEPNAASSPKQQSMEELNQDAEPVQEANDSVPPEPAPEPEKSPETDVTVGLALMPETQINETILPSSLLKQVICEVPSELRKLATPHTNVRPHASKHSSRTMQKKRGKRCAKTRMTRGRVSNLHIKVKHMLSNLIHNEAPADFHDASDLDVYESEILQRNISYGSFHSLKEETLEKFDSLKIDASVGCEIKMDTKDRATVTLVEKQDSGIQVNDELAIELQMIDIPAHVRYFLGRLKASASNTKFLFNSSVFNMKIYKHWRSDFQFRQGLTNVSKIFSYDSDVSGQACLESYEDFVNAMNCLHVLEELFKPHKIAVCIWILKPNVEYFLTDLLAPPALTLSFLFF